MCECRIIVDLRINETLQTGAVRNRTYRVGLNTGWGEYEPHWRSWKQRLPYTGSESVYLFLGFTTTVGWFGTSTDR